jgi:hypothetical protein
MAGLASTTQLLARIRFTNAAAAVIVDQQGIDELSEIKILRDSEIEGLCKVVRRPGGSIVNPNAATAGQPATIYATGESISMIAESNLKLASFYLRHQERIGRTADYADVTLDSVRSLRDLRQYEKDHVDPTTEPTIDTKDWSATMEAIEEWLRGHLGVNKVPLAYVVRKEKEVPASADDPSGNYETVIDEMIARAPIETAVPGTFVASFIEDRRKVWDLMAGLLRDKECWTYVKPHQRARDGRGGFLEIWNHFLGPNNAGNMATRAERTLENTSYVGEKRRWNFEKFVGMLKKQHTILDNLQADGMHNGINGLSKVRLLNQGIKTKELDVPKSQIMASAELRQDFDACISLYKDFIEAHATINPTFNVSETKTTGTRKAKDGKYPPRRGGPKRGSDYDDHDDEDVEDRYYSSKEYDKLTKNQKFLLKKKRDGRGGGPSKRSKTGGQDKRLASMERTISKLVAETSKVSFEDADDEKSDSDTDSNKKKNRNNSALTRQSKKGGK